MNIYEMLALITIRFALKRIVKSDKPFIFVFLTLKAPSDIFYAVLVEATMPPAIIGNAILAHYRLREEGIGVTILLTLMVLILFLVFRVIV